MSQTASMAPSASSAKAHLIERVASAPLMASPFPYFYRNNVFPADIYAEMRRQLPAREAYKKINETDRTKGDYEQRLIFHLSSDLARLPQAQGDFWRDVASWMCNQDFATALLRKFAATFTATVGKPPERLSFLSEAMLVKDLSGYSIGPHTDLKNRAVSIMFYMPSSARYESYGTAIYKPTDPGFTSDGAYHFGYENFKRVTTMRCRPNTMFAFQRSDHSFHGVEPIDDPECERDVLLYILRWRDPAAGLQRAGARS